MAAASDVRAISCIGEWKKRNLIVRPKKTSVLMMGPGGRINNPGTGSLDMINGKKVNGVYVPNSVKHKEDRDVKERSMIGSFVEDMFVYRQTFVIRSYEIGPDKTATMETLMNLLQVRV